MRILDQRAETRKLDCVDPDSLPELTTELFRGEGAKDRPWFERHPDRRYRVRKMTRNEMIAVGTPPSGVAYAVVKQLRPGARIRRFFTVGSALQSPIGERQSELFWNWSTAAIMPPAPIASPLVLAGRVVGTLLSQGHAGIEARDAQGKSLGLFQTPGEAIDALSKFLDFLED
jgi:hypothetical protein